MDSSENITPDPGGPRRRLHAGIVTAGAVVAMTLAGLGVAGAQTGDSGSPSTAPGQSAKVVQAKEKAGDCGERPGPLASLEVAARAIGITVEELRAAVREGRSIAQVAQSKGVEPQKVIDALVADARDKLPDRMAALVNREGGRHCGPGHKRHHGPGMKARLDVAATAIGVNEGELRTALRDGRSIADVARSKNIDPKKVVDALVAEAKERLAMRVQAGDMTQAEADKKAAALAERVEALVNRTPPRPPRGPAS